MLISPVCVPPVSELHQQHELDQEEKEPADRSHIAPHCGREHRDTDTQTLSHTTDGIFKMCFCTEKFCSFPLVLCLSRCTIKHYVDYWEGYTDTTAWYYCLYIYNVCVSIYKYIYIFLKKAFRALPSRNFSSSGRKKPPAQHAASPINFNSQNLTHKHNSNVKSGRNIKWYRATFLFQNA